LLRRVLREPLVYCLTAGAILFVLFGRNAAPALPDREIDVSAADIERLAATFERTWHRPPSNEELRTAVNDFVREEVLYRTAVSLGLDKDDTVIRRRLRQKMEFLFEDTVSAPQDGELRLFFAHHPEKFQVESLVSFRQLFIDLKRHDDADAEARRVLAQLQSGEDDASANGDPILLPESFSRITRSRVAEAFGAEFADQLTRAPPARWTGPLRSTFGLHLVLLSGLEPARVPPFETVREAVQREWFAEHRAAALEAQYQDLRGKFSIQVGYPTPGPK
jgi:hypothetical protein